MCQIGAQTAGMLRPPAAGDEILQKCGFLRRWLLSSAPNPDSVQLVLLLLQQSYCYCFTLCCYLVLELLCIKCYCLTPVLFSAEASLHLETL